MSRSKFIERPNGIRVSTISHLECVRQTKSFNCPSNINVIPVRKFHSFSKNPDILEYNITDEQYNTYHSRHNIHAKINHRHTLKESFKKNEVQPLPTETESKMSTRKSKESTKTKSVSVTKVLRQQSQERESNKGLRTTTDSETKLIQTDSSIKHETQQDQNTICNNFSYGRMHNINQILSDELNHQDSKTITNKDNQINELSRHIRSIPFSESYRFTEKDQKQRKKRKYRRCRQYGCRCCSPRCAVISIFSILLLLIALTVLLIALLTKNKNTTTTILTTTITMTTVTSSTATTSSSATSSTTTSSTATTSTTTSSSTTKSTTTTAYNCGQSCLNQSWIDPSNLLALWSFEGSYADSTNFYNGTPSTNPPSFVTGYLGQAASFNGSAKQTVRTSFIPLNNVSFTVETWIKPSAYLNTDSHIVGLCPVGSSNYCFQILIRSQKLYFGFYSNDISGTTNISLNQWTHIACVYEVTKQTQTIYVNGIQNNQRSGSSPFLSSSGNFTIATNEHVSSSNGYYQGYIDELSINQRSMSSCEILERATLAAYFKFDTSSPYRDFGPNAVDTTSFNTSIVTGYLNQAIAFNDSSSSSYFQASGFTSLGISNQSFSTTFWIQPQILSGMLVHLSSSSSGTGPTCFPLLGFASNGAIVAQVLISAATLVTVTGPILPVSSSWIPIVQTWSATNGLKLYVNSTLVSSATASSFLGSGTAPNYVTLGSCLNGCGVCSNGSVDTSSSFQGVIDDWRIYSRELTAIDVCTLFRS